MYENRSWLIKNKLNMIMMKKGVIIFLGTHDFSSMRAASCSAKSPIRTITKAEIKRKRR